MAHDRYKTNCDRDRVRHEERESIGTGALLLRTTWQAKNELQRARVAKVLEQIADLSEERWHVTRERLTQWQAFLSEHAQHTLSARHDRALRAIERTLTLIGEGKEPPPFPNGGRSRTFIPNPIKRPARPDWMRDPALLPKAPPKPGKREP